MKTIFNIFWINYDFPKKKKKFYADWTWWLIKQVSQSIFFNFFFKKKVRQSNWEKETGYFHGFTFNFSDQSFIILLLLCVLLFPRWASKGAAVSVLPRAFVSSLSGGPKTICVGFRYTHCFISRSPLCSEYQNMAVLHFGGCISFTL